MRQKQQKNCGFRSIIFPGLEQNQGLSKTNDAFRLCKRPVRNVENVFDPSSVSALLCRLRSSSKIDFPFDPGQQRCRDGRLIKKKKTPPREAITL